MQIFVHLQNAENTHSKRLLLSPLMAKQYSFCCAVQWWRFLYCAVLPSECGHKIGDNPHSGRRAFRNCSFKRKKKKTILFSLWGSENCFVRCTCWCGHFDLFQVKIVELKWSNANLLTCSTDSSFFLTLFLLLVVPEMEQFLIFTALYNVPFLRLAEEKRFSS